MEKFNSYESLTFDEILKKYEGISSYKNIKEAYKQARPDILAQIKVNNDNYVDALISAANTIIC